jgi:hypothetical protein
MTFDEVFVTVVATVAGPILWGAWLSQMARLEIVRRRAGGVFALSLTLIACALLIFIVLRVGASSDVTDAPVYLFVYVAGGLAWLWAAQLMFPYLGLSPRDDVFERRNEAAVFPLMGAMIGVTLCYAGGNVGPRRSRPGAHCYRRLAIHVTRRGSVQTTGSSSPPSAVSVKAWEFPVSWVAAKYDPSRGRRDGGRHRGWRSGGFSRFR